MPKDIFTVKASGEVKIDNGEGIDKLKNLVNLLVKGKKENKNKQVKGKMDEEGIWRDFLKDLYRANVVINQKPFNKGVPVGESKSLQAQLKKEFFRDFFQKAINTTHLTELHQGIAADVRMFVDQSYSIAGMQGNFLPSDHNKKLTIRRNGRLYSHEFKADCYFFMDGEFTYCLNQYNKMEKVDLTEFNLEKAIQQKKVKPICTLSSLVDVDYNMKPVEVRSHTEVNSDCSLFRYIGARNAPELVSLQNVSVEELRRKDQFLQIMIKFAKKHQLFDDNKYQESMKMLNKEFKTSGPIPVSVLESFCNAYLEKINKNFSDKKKGIMAQSVRAQLDGLKKAKLYSSKLEILKYLDLQLQRVEAPKVSFWQRLLDIRLLSEKYALKGKNDAHQNTYEKPTKFKKKELSIHSEPKKDFLISVFIREAEERLKTKYKRQRENKKMGWRVEEGPNNQYLKIEINRNTYDKDLLKISQNANGEIESNLSLNPSYKAIGVIFELNKEIFPLTVSKNGDIHSLLKLYKASRYNNQVLIFDESDQKILESSSEYASLKKMNDTQFQSYISGKGELGAFEQAFGAKVPEEHILDDKLSLKVVPKKPSSPSYR